MPSSLPLWLWCVAVHGPPERLAWKPQSYERSSYFVSHAEFVLSGGCAGPQTEVPSGAAAACGVTPGLPEPLPCSQTMTFGHSHYMLRLDGERTLLGKRCTVPAMLPFRCLHFRRGCQASAMTADAQKMSAFLILDDIEGYQVGGTYTNIAGSEPFFTSASSAGWPQLHCKPHRLWLVPVHETRNS